LAPAEIARVIIDEEDKSMEVIVPDEFLSVAIGKRGQNVRLASKLTGWHLDVNSEAQYDEAMEKGYASLVQISGVGAAMADALFEKGLYSAEELANAEIEDLVDVRGIGEEKAKQVIAKAQEWVDAAPEREAAEAEARAKAEAEAAEAEAIAKAEAEAEAESETEEADSDVGSDDEPTSQEEPEDRPDEDDLQAIATDDAQVDASDVAGEPKTDEPAAG
jgi:N utilization substance protein A